MSTKQSSNFSTRRGKIAAAIPSMTKEQTASIVLELLDSVAALEAQVISQQTEIHDLATALKAVTSTQPTPLSTPSTPLDAPTASINVPMDCIPDNFRVVTSRKAMKRQHISRNSRSSSPAKSTSSVKITPPDSHSTDSESDSESTPAERSPPPILIQDPLVWSKVQKAISHNGIDVRRAVNTSSGVRVYPRTTDGFRTLTSYLDSKQIHYSTHQLHEDRDLVVVIRGVNQSLTEDDIKTELSNKIPRIRRVHRMKNGDQI